MTTWQDKIEAIRAVLLESWDPIGILDAGGPQDEYDAYIPAILQLVERRVSVAELARHLGDIATNEMGLVDVAERDKATAERLLRLRLSE